MAYAFHQSLDAMIGAANIPAGLGVEPVIGSEWIWPRDPRRAQLQRETAASHEAAE